MRKFSAIDIFHDHAPALLAEIESSEPKFAAALKFLHADRGSLESIADGFFDDANDRVWLRQNGVNNDVEDRENFIGSDDDSRDDVIVGYRAEASRSFALTTIESC
jgi:hypothetical protein